MKKIQLLLPALFLSLVLFAQENSSGKVFYEQVIQLEIKLEGDAAQFADMLPKERKSQKVLYFNNKATLFENNGSAESEDVSMHSGGANVMIRMQEPENKVFIDLEKQQQIEQREFMTRTFLIEGEIQHQWKLTGNQKMILEYPCQEALLETEKDTISAWFTSLIPVSGGPANYCGLPGMILEVTTKDGKQSTKAISVDFSPFAEDVLTKPGKGKKVTREEYDSIVEEKMKEMGAEQGEGGHQMMIRIQR